jgi:hypothetical protein
VAKLEAEKAAAAEGNKKEEASRQAGAGGGGRGAGLRKGEPPPPAASAPAAPAPAPTPVVQAAPDPAAREAELKSAPVYCLLLANERFAELRARAVQAFDERAWSSSAPADLLSGLESKAKKADPSSLGFSGGPSQGLGLDARVLWLSDEEFASVQKAAEELGRFRPALPEERTQVRQLLERESLSKDDAGKGPPPAAPAPGAAKAPPAQQDLSKSREAPKSPAEPSRPPVPEASPKPDAETKPSGRVAATAGGERAPAPDYRRRAEADRAPAPVRRAYVIRILPERLPSGR